MSLYMKNTLNKGWKNRGFTLIEIAISMALITIGLLAVLRLQAMNLDLQTEAEFLTTAGYLAQERISRVVSRGTIEEGTDSGRFGEDFPTFQYREEVSKVSDSDHLFKVRVSVWRDGEPTGADLSEEVYIFRKPTEETKD